MSEAAKYPAITVHGADVTEAATRRISEAIIDLLNTRRRAHGWVGELIRVVVDWDTFGLAGRFYVANTNPAGNPLVCSGAWELADA